MPYKKQKAIRSNKKCYLRPNDRFEFNLFFVPSSKMCGNLELLANSPNRETGGWVLATFFLHIIAV